MSDENEILEGTSQTVVHELFYAADMPWWMRWMWWLKPKPVRFTGVFTTSPTAKPDLDLGIRRIDPKVERQAP